MFDTDYGVVNYVLVNWFGLEQFTQHSWLIDPLSFFLVAGIIIVWGAVPFVAFALYAGLTQVPDEVLEAAQLDGAGGVQRFRLIVFPYLKPIFLIVDDPADHLGPQGLHADLRAAGHRRHPRLTNTLGVYIYQVSIAGGDFGTGGAIAVITAIILMSVSLYYIRQVRQGGGAVTAAIAPACRSAAAAGRAAAVTAPAPAVAARGSRPSGAAPSRSCSSCCSCSPSTGW